MRWLAIAALAACTHSGKAPPVALPDGGGSRDPGLGAHFDGDAVSFEVASTRATRIELWIYAEPTGPETMHVAMMQDGAVWRARVPASELPATIYYGYRVWGPNWTYDPAWQPGSEAGFVADVDSAGNRMNPNKLVFDPYTRELAFDPGGGGARDVDTGPTATKGIVLADDAADFGARPARAFADDVIYEVQLRGFTEAAMVPCAGTYAGAAAKASYLASLGVTAVELLPIAETKNDHNDDDPTSDAGDNDWGYSTLAYFAPDRRYACDRTPGGPTREVRAMVKAFHAAGIKVLLDVVYNHTAEGGGITLLSLRGLDNSGYYQLDAAGTGFTNSNGVGADLATAKPLAAGLVLDSLHYWHDQIGVDGFRFDLAPVLGNVCGPGCFKFDPAFPAQIAASLPDAILIAEPWVHDGDAAAQRQAVRTGLLLVMVSSGVPMITGGDELGRTIHCNNNPYNLDSVATWLDWSTQGDPLWTFTHQLLAFRAAHPELHPGDFGAQIAWDAHMDDATWPTLAWRTGNVYVAYNRSPNPATITLPAGPTWYREADTGAWLEDHANWDEYMMHQSQYNLAPRSAAVFLAK
jgi:glycogen operon protein